MICRCVALFFLLLIIDLGSTRVSRRRSFLFALLFGRSLHVRKFTEAGAFTKSIGHRFTQMKHGCYSIAAPYGRRNAKFRAVETTAPAPGTGALPGPEVDQTAWAIEVNRPYLLYGAIRSVSVSLWKAVWSRKRSQPPSFLAVCATLFFSFVAKSSHEL